MRITLVLAIGARYRSGCWACSKASLDARRTFGEFLLPGASRQPCLRHDIDAWFCRWSAPMELRGPSRTAINTAMQRAAHLLLGDEPKILADTFARAFAGYASDADMLDAMDPSKWIAFPRMRVLFAMRNRYAEDELARAMTRGIEQYIILGAGLDSFAYRRPDLMASLDVFEVDHPASQAWKRARVEELGIAVPARLHHLAIDFERQTLGEGLAESVVDLSRPVYLSMLGVAQYLTTDAMLQTLRDVAAITVPGSEIVLQFVVPPAMLASDEAALVEALAERARLVGEPWISFYQPADMEQHLRDAGFGSIVYFGPEEATARYLQGHSDGLLLPAYFRMVHARLLSSASI
jgi:methyltransferase (TIGR00027 family)